MNVGGHLAEGTGRSPDLAIRLLRDSSSALALDSAQWDLAIRQARQADVLARIACQLEASGVLEEVPFAPREHLRSALIFCEAQARDVRRELRYLAEALRPVDEPVVLLKGAAYLLGNEAAAIGRQFSDVDILLPRASLPSAEQALMLNGWMTTHHSAYDQRYYREWMHELPPMQHVGRMTVVDVHHTILPPTARRRVDATKLLAAAVLAAPATDHGAELRVLSPCDMLLHSMAHLFYNEEMSHGLRDLSDIDLLLRAFAAREADFWMRLLARAGELDLQRPLHYALRFSARVLGTPIPSEVLHRTKAWAPPWPLAMAMDAVWSRALQSQHESSAPSGTVFALLLLYVRAHWLRMPPALLARHLTIKAWRRFEDEKPAAA